MRHPWQLFNVFWDNGDGDGDSAAASAATSADAAAAGYGGIGAAPSTGIGSAPGPGVGDTGFGGGSVGGVSDGVAAGLSYGGGAANTGYGGGATGYGTAATGYGYGGGAGARGGVSAPAAASGAGGGAATGGGGGTAAGGSGARGGVGPAAPYGPGNTGGFNTLSLIGQFRAAIANGLISPAEAAATLYRGSPSAVQFLSDQDKANFAAQLRSGFQAPGFGDIGVTNNMLTSRAAPNFGGLGFGGSAAPNALSDFANVSNPYASQSPFGEGAPGFGYPSLRGSSVAAPTPVHTAVAPPANAPYGFSALSPQQLAIMRGQLQAQQGGMGFPSLEGVSPGLTAAPAGPSPANYASNALGLGGMASVTGPGVSSAPSAAPSAAPGVSGAPSAYASNTVRTAPPSAFSQVLSQNVAENMGISAGGGTVGSGRYASPTLGVQPYNTGRYA